MNESKIHHPSQSTEHSKEQCKKRPNIVDVVSNAQIFAETLGYGKMVCKWSAPSSICQPLTELLRSQSIVRPNCRLQLARLAS